MSILVALAEVKGYELTKAGLQLWWRSMQDWDIDDFDRATLHISRTVRYKIQPCDYFDLLHESVSSADEAWYRVIAFAERNRWRGSLEDPIIDEALQSMGGLRALGRRPEGSMNFAKNDFVKIYEAIVKRHVACGSVPLKLPTDMRPAIENQQTGETR